MRVFSCFVLLLLALSSAYGADRYWIAGANGNWSDPTNWSISSGGVGGASVPSDADVAIFDGAGAGDCTLDQAIDVAGITLSTGFTGALVHGSFDVSIGTSDFTIEGGSFLGGQGAINLGDALNLLGGTLQAPSGLFTISGSATISGGSFLHNDGSVEFDGAGGRTFSCTLVPTVRFHDVNVNMGHNKALSIGADDSLVVENKITLTNGLLNNGTLVVEDTCLVEAGWDNGSSSLHFSGSGNAWFQFNGNDWSGNDVFVNMPSVSDRVIVQDVDGDNAVTFGSTSKALTVSSGVLAFESGLFVDLNFQNLYLEADGTIEGSDNEIVFQGSYEQRGGFFDGNGGLFTFNGAGARTFTASNASRNIFYDFAMEMGNNKALSITAGDSLWVSNKARLSNGKLNNGILAVEDTCLVEAGWDNGSSELSFIGDGNAWYQFDADIWNGNDVSVNLNSATDSTFIQDVDGDKTVMFGATNKALTVYKGALAFESGLYADLNFQNLNIESEGILVGSDNEIAYQGNYTQNGGQFDGNGGLFTFNGTGGRSFTVSNANRNTFHNVAIEMGNNKTLSITAGDSLRVSNKITLSNGVLNNGVLAVEDTCLVEAGWDNGTTDLSFIGDGNAWYQFDGNDWSGNDVYVNLNAESDTTFVQDIDGDKSVSFGATNKALTIEKGVLAFEAGLYADINFQNLYLEDEGTLVGSDNEIAFQGSYTHNGGQFDGNGGLFTFDGAGARSFTASNTGRNTFYNVAIQMGNNKTLSITAGDSLRVSNKITLSNGLLNNGTLAVEDTCLVESGWDNGSTELSFIGDGNAWYQFNNDDWSGNNVFINLTLPTDTTFIQDQDGDLVASLGSNNTELTIRNGVLAFDSGTYADLNFENLILERNGVLQGSDNEIAFQGNYIHGGGLYVGNAGLFTFDGAGARTFTSSDAAQNRFYNVNINLSNNKTLSITNGDTLLVSNKISLSNGLLNNGTLAVEDSCVVEAGWDNGNSDLSFVGDGNAWFLFNGNDWSGNDVFVDLDQSSDTTFVGDVDGDNAVQFGNNSNVLTIDNGHLAFESGVLADLEFQTLLIQAGGTLVGSDNEIKFQGSYQNDGGALAHNQGKFTFDGDGARSFTCSSSPTDEFYDVDFAMSHNKTLTINDTMHIINVLYLSNGIANGLAFKLEGDVVGTNFDGGTTDLVFAGSARQTVDMGSSPSLFNADVKLMQGVADTIELVSAFTLDNSGQTMVFEKGFLLSTKTNLLTLGHNVTVSGANDSSYVSGPMTKTGKNAFEFPVGKDSVFAPIAISSPSSTSHSFQAEYFKESPHPTYDRLSKDLTINRISGCEYWILDRTAGTSNISVTLSWDTRSCGVGDPSTLLVARWDGGTWRDHGNGGTTGDANQGTVTSSSAITSFSPFTLASYDASNPLPVELLTFEVKSIGQFVQVEWSTASERNNELFVVERSTDGENWEVIAEKDGAGNSSVLLNYLVEDTKPMKGIAYYRLKQIDFDGKFSYSPIRSIEFTGEEELAVFPNPATEQFTIRGKGVGETEIHIFNALGQEVSQHVIPKSVHADEVQLDISRLAKGVYWLEVGENPTEIVVKQ